MWGSSLPGGFLAQRDAAQAAEIAYHAIADTPIQELQTNIGTRRIGTLVTDARDKYRRWQSYGSYFVPTPPNRVGVRWSSGMEYLKGEARKAPNLLIIVGQLGTQGWGEAAVSGVIKSSRGKVIMGGAYNDESNWRVGAPFDDILIGDRIADIPNLIGRIKR